MRSQAKNMYAHGCARVLPALALAALLSYGCQPPQPSTETLDLNLAWSFSLGSQEQGSGIPADLLEHLSGWTPAQVPGTIHTDLLTAGLIPDPFWRDRELTLQWIGEEDWRYRTTFQVPPRFLERERLNLVFQGLDTYAQVLVNGNPVLEADNMFREWVVDVKPDIRPGENSLEILFSSPLPPAIAARNALSYELPAGNDRGDPPSRVFVRKAAYHYGWDWGPRFVTSGIWRPVELLAWSGARITDLHLVADSISPESAQVRALVEVEVSREEAERRAAGGGVPITLTASSPEGAFGPASMDVEVDSGVNRFELALQIPDPHLWWPNGLGDPHLYSVQVDLKAGRRTDSLTSRMGIRTLELVTQPDSLGESFFFRVNGVPVFMKGANIIPLDHFSPRVKTEDYRKLFQDVVEANMNMLRIWGGGIYETDLFYTLADEHGILLWQDFMFANGMYPGDSLFLENVRNEATYQVRRLRTHPSVALWCGNNEMDEGWKNWGWARNYDTPEDSATVRNAYDAIFHDILPNVVASEDPDRRYWPSSPSLGWGDPESLNRGDSHYWGVWHGQEPFQVFAEKLPRFSSEFGFQAFPPMETVDDFTDPSDRRLSDPTLLVHQKHPIGNEIISSYMERSYPVPPAFEDFVYVSQLLQARGMRTAFEAHRRGMPRTMGTLYWQLNDTWPVVSWSSRDYFGRWKALHYAAKEAFAPVLLSPVLRGDSLEIWGVSDLTEPLGGTLKLELLNFQGAGLWEHSLPTTLPPNQSTRIWVGAVPQLGEDWDSKQAVLVGEFQGEGGQTPSAGSILYFHAPKDLELSTPTIRLDLEVRGSDPVPGYLGPQTDEDQILLTLEADVLAKDVYLTLDGARFSHNFFDLLPGRPKTIRVETELPISEIEAGLRVKTLAEVPREGTTVEPEAIDEGESGVGSNPR